MKIHNKLFYIIMTALIFSFVACSDTKETDSHTKTTQTQEIQNPQGNWQVKGDYLSTANKHDIKTDLAQLTLISQAYNRKVLKMHEDVKTAGNNPEKIKQILVETNTIRDYFKQKYITLHLKSSEVQNIRTLIIDNFMISEQFYTLSMQADFNMNTTNDEFKQLSKRSKALQQKIDTELEGLNAKYIK
ncbi:hypothetical protein A7P53_07335 [Acinetobacter defluvii]|uniref:hypothetical protein n=1 Tax=Acinetobacter defluvii TaxID=1871111 RepID=UPI00148F905C|nr:hypothetical protein [Acinetobacter defluvii]NNP72278.1 hypothetical protein [Acinetobacter defluvii]